MTSPSNNELTPDVRLAMAELRLKQHDELHKEMQNTMKQLAEGIAQLVQAEARREQDQTTLKRVFEELEGIRKDFSDYKMEQVRVREKQERALQDYKDSQTTKELNAYKGVVIKVVGLALVVMASVVAGHFGGKWLG
jgi:predicted  nucleic acid-binding Zn-ribbon protein